MAKVKKLIMYAILVYILLFFIVFLPFGAFPGSDFVGGSLTYFGLIILAAVHLYVSIKE